MSYAQLKSPGLALPDWKTTTGGDAAADGAGSWVGAASISSKRTTENEFVLQ